MAAWLGGHQADRLVVRLGGLAASTIAAGALCAYIALTIPQSRATANLFLTPFERMIARRYLLPGRGEAFIALVAGISLAAVTLGVAALVAAAGPARPWAGAPPTTAALCAASPMCARRR